MFNLLPEQQKKALLREYKLRAGIVALCFSFAVIVASGIFLLPSFFLSNVKERELTSQLSSAQPGVVVKEAADLGNIIAQTKKTIALLQAGDSVSFVTLFQKIMSQRVSGVTLSAVSIGDGTGGKRDIILSGQAQTRESLTAFKKALESDKTFAKVDLPVSNLAKSKDIAFTLTISAHF